MRRSPSRDTAMHWAAVGLFQSHRSLQIVQRQASVLPSVLQSVAMRACDRLIFPKHRRKHPMQMHRLHQRPAEDREGRTRACAGEPVLMPAVKAADSVHASTLQEKHQLDCRQNYLQQELEQREAAETPSAFFVDRCRAHRLTVATRHPDQSSRAREKSLRWKEGLPRVAFACRLQVLRPIEPAGSRRFFQERLRDRKDRLPP